jgi:hypothetical protein
MITARGARLFALMTAAVAATVATTAVAPGALASDGKATLGCSSPYTAATYGDGVAQHPGDITMYQVSVSLLVPGGPFTVASLDALLASIDHNGDFVVCYKLPPGWNGPPATSGAQRAGFVNLVDDKLV